MKTYFIQNMLLHTINVLIKKTEKELKRQIAKAEKESRAFKSLDQEHLVFHDSLSSEVSSAWHSMSLKKRTTHLPSATYAFFRVAE